jgi:hypothetical protein
MLPDTDSDYAEQLDYQCLIALKRLGLRSPQGSHTIPANLCTAPDSHIITMAGPARPHVTASATIAHQPG